MVSGKLVATGIGFILQSIIFGGFAWTLIGGFIIAIATSSRTNEGYGKLPFTWLPFIVYAIIVLLYFAILFASNFSNHQSLFSNISWF